MRSSGGIVRMESGVGSESIIMASVVWVMRVWNKQEVWGRETESRRLQAI